MKVSLGSGLEREDGCSHQLSGNDSGNDSERIVFSSRVLGGLESVIYSVPSEPRQ